MLDIKIPNFSPWSNLGGLIDNLIQLAFFAAGLFFFFQMVVGGLQWINAGGDPKAMQSARGRITSAVIGLVIVVGAFAVTRIVERVFGIRITTGFQF